MNTANLSLNPDTSPAGLRRSLGAGRLLLVASHSV